MADEDYVAKVELETKMEVLMVGLAFPVLKQREVEIVADAEVLAVVVADDGEPVVVDVEVAVVIVDAA